MWLLLNDQEHLAIGVKTLMLVVSAAYLGATNLAAAVKPGAETAATEMATTLMHCVAIVVALKPLAVVTCVQKDGLFGCFSCQNQFQTVVAVVPAVPYFLTAADVITYKTSWSIVGAKWK